MLPEFLLLVIFESLPLADVCHARAVCKLWNEIVLEAKLVSRYQQAWLYSTKSNGNQEVWCPSTGERRPLELTDECHRPLYPLAASRGLVLCKREDDSLTIGNPLTRNWKQLPAPFPEELTVPRTAGSRIHLLVDASFARYKVTLFPTIGWLHKKQKYWSHLAAFVLHFDSETGIWIKTGGVAHKWEDARKCGTWSSNFTVLEGYVLYDLDTRSWFWIEADRPQPLIGSRSWWTWLTFKRDKDPLMWASFTTWLYRGIRMIGAGMTKILNYDGTHRMIGFSILELDPNTRRWKPLAATTLRDVYDNQQIETCCITMRPELHGDIVFWSRQDSKFTPLAYDLVQSVWKAMDKPLWDARRREFTNVPTYLYCKALSLNLVVRP